MEVGGFNEELEIAESAIERAKYCTAESLKFFFATPHCLYILISYLVTNQHGKRRLQTEQDQ